MVYRPATIERAYELAKSGDCATVEDIRLKLVQEGYTSVVHHLSAPLLKRSLKGLCKSAYRNGEALPAPATDS